MDRRKTLLVNIGEAETDSVLRETADKLGSRVFVKPRLADVVHIDRSGLSNDEYGYALKAHLDFVLARASDGRALFAVEFDEPHHDTDPGARRRDTMKNAICERLGLPLLRIDAEYLRTVQDFRLLAWLVELWFLDDAFSAAQERGEIPWDEPFDAYSVVQAKEGGGITFPYSLTTDAQGEIWQAYSEGRCVKPVPDHYWRTTEESGEAYAMLPLPDDRWLISYVRIRGFRFSPVTPGELAEELAVVDIAAKLEELERGVARTATSQEWEAIVAEIQSSDRRWSFGGYA